MTARQELPHLSRWRYEALQKITTINRKFLILMGELLPFTVKAKLATMFEVAREVSCMLFVWMSNLIKILKKVFLSGHSWEREVPKRWNFFHIRTGGGLPNKVLRLPSGQWIRGSQTPEKNKWQRWHKLYDIWLQSCPFFISYVMSLVSTLPFIFLAGLVSSIRMSRSKTQYSTLSLKTSLLKTSLLLEPTVCSVLVSRRTCNFTAH